MKKQKKAVDSAVQKMSKTKEKKAKKEKLKNLELLISNGYGYKMDEEHVLKVYPAEEDYKELHELLAFFNDEKEKAEEQKEKKKKQNLSIKSIDFLNLKKYKKEVNLQIEILQGKKKKYTQQQNYNFVNILDKKIEKLLFYLQIYTSQIFDLYNNMDSQQKYEMELLHFDLMLKDSVLNEKLLYYRLLNVKTRQYDDFGVFEKLKGSKFDYTESKIIDTITNSIILDEISKNDTIKLEFIKVYYKKLYKQNGQKEAKTISNYKKYIRDRYSYLFSD